MAKKKEDQAPEAETKVADQGEAQAPAQEAAQAPAPKAKKAEADSVTVKFRDHEGKPTERTFDRATHGEDFAKLAEEFKATNASKLIA
jgi:hypothetical protein